LAARFGPAHVAGIGELTCRAVGPLPAGRRAWVRCGTAAIDLHGTRYQPLTVHMDDQPVTTDYYPVKQHPT
jgi:hypothetical protein